MYKACIEGDNVAVEMLLERNPSLASDELSDDGDRALHVAASMKHQEIVRKLVQKMGPSELALQDGHGYTACCYAAISGSVEIADLMIRKDPSLATGRDQGKMTPLQKAALRGNGEMVSYFLKSAKVGGLSTQEWFDILLATISRVKYEVALEILEIDEQLAIMSNDDGTALHLLAGQGFCMTMSQYKKGVMKREMRLLAKKLFAVIQGLGQSTAVELLKNPPILHNAAKVGNMELITMLTQVYPNLIWLTNSKGYMFHIAVIHRRENVFRLINEIGARKDMIAVWQDEDGNNILHLVGKPPEKSKLSWLPPLRMLREVVWFEKVVETVPPLCRKMKNKNGETAGELFFKEHNSLLEEGKTWMRNVADSCMLIASLIFTVIFGFAFAVPGGYNQVTGIPVLLGTNWFTIFVLFEGAAMFTSAISIVSFLKILMTSAEEHLTKPMVYLFFRGLVALSLAVLAAVSVFMSAYFLIYSRERATQKKHMIILYPMTAIYLLLVSLVCVQIYLFYINLPEKRFRWYTPFTLLKRPDDIMVSKSNRKLWCRSF